MLAEDQALRRASVDARLGQNDGQPPARYEARTGDAVRTRHKDADIRGGLTGCTVRTVLSGDVGPRRM
jgi:hypothetical protein